MSEAVLQIGTTCEAPDICGFMNGSVIIPPGVDLTEPILEDSPEAESGEGPW